MAQESRNSTRFSLATDAANDLIFDDVVCALED
jgi:hypothetical protein